MGIYDPFGTRSRDCDRTGGGSQQRFHRQCRRSGYHGDHDAGDYVYVDGTDRGGETGRAHGPDDQRTAAGAYISVSESTKASSGTGIPDSQYSCQYSGTWLGGNSYGTEGNDGACTVRAGTDRGRNVPQRGASDRTR